MAAQRADRLFIPICLTCEVDENLRRVTSEERKRSSTTKLTDSEGLRSIRDSHSIYMFGMKEELTLDVTETSPKDAAMRIFQWAIKVSRA